MIKNPYDEKKCKAIQCIRVNWMHSQGRDYFHILKLTAKLIEIWFFFTHTSYKFRPNFSTVTHMKWKIVLKPRTTYTYKVLRLKIETPDEKSVLTCELQTRVVKKLKIEDAAAARAQLVF